MNNCLWKDYGKHPKTGIRLVNRKSAEKLAAKAYLWSDLAAIHMKKTKPVFNKPVYLGMCKYTWFIKSVDA